LGTQKACASINTSPKPTIVLNDSQRFIAQISWNSMALYRVSNGTIINRFKSSGWINCIAATPDEKLLLLACSNGSLSLWEIETGELLWGLSGRQTGLHYVYDVCFSHDGQSFIVSNFTDPALVFRTNTGERIGAVGFRQTNIMSAALSPDGSKGVAIELGQHIHTFDLATAVLTDTRFEGGWPIRYSVDGKHIACRSSNSGADERLAIMTVGETLTRQDLGQFTYITNITPCQDGSFLVTANIGKIFDYSAHMVGIQVWPINGELREIWRLPLVEKTRNEQDSFAFATPGLIGVSTNYRLVTTVMDLRTGKHLLTIDNSANVRPDLYLSGLLIGGGIFVAIGLIAVVIRRQWPSATKAMNVLALGGAAVSPFLVLQAYLCFVVGHCPINDWAFLYLAVGVGVACFLDTRFISLRLRLGLSPVYGTLMFILGLFYGLSATSHLFTEAFVRF
jgi:hypothetical protein